MEDQGRTQTGRYVAIGHEEIKQEEKRDEEGKEEEEVRESDESKPQPATPLKDKRKLNY